MIGIQEVVHAVTFVLKYASVNNVTPNQIHSFTEYVIVLFHNCI